MNLRKFFEENDIILENGIFRFRNKRKRSKDVQPHMPAHAPGIIKDIADVFKVFYENGIPIKRVDSPVLVAIIQRHLGFTKDWSYTVASCIYFMLAVTSGGVTW